MRNVVTVNERSKPAASTALLSGAGVMAFPDIDAAWHKAMNALAEEGIRPGGLPLFLVLGRPASAEKNVFDAAKFKLVAGPAPSDPLDPVHVFADQKGIYV